TQLHGEIHDFHDLRRVGFGQRSAEDREVLREGKDLTAPDQTMAGDDAVTWYLLRGHPEVETAVCDEFVEFLERAGIEEQIDSLPRRQLARLVLAPKPLLAAAPFGAALEVRQRVAGIHLGFHRLRFFPILQEF